MAGKTLKRAGKKTINKIKAENIQANMELIYKGHHYQVDSVMKDEAKREITVCTGEKIDAVIPYDEEVQVHESHITKLDGAPLTAGDWPDGSMDM